MKIASIMNFARQIDERMEDSENILFNATRAELEMVNEFGLDNTFLLQYDVLCDPRYAELFRKKGTEKTELGIWYEIVEPLTSACGLPYKSERGWRWDWHIVPGFSMAYTPREREMLIDEAMRKFCEVYGYYPRTVASWLIDTHTVRYLAEHYDVDAIAICRDQTNTDAYTLHGGYFNQAYYPCKNNVFTPAQSEGEQVNVPVFRLLGPCPIHNYDNKKYLTHAWDARLHCGCFTMEPVGSVGAAPENVDWFFKTYYKNEDLGFSWTQIGQENSFGYTEFFPQLRMQIEKLTEQKDVQVMKMCDAGAWFKKTYASTPATSVVALDNWDVGSDAQSVWYDCQSFSANLFRFERSIFIRSWHLFDDRVHEHYLSEKCTTFDAVYENLPLVDALFWNDGENYKSGIQIDGDATAFTVERCGEDYLAVKWKDCEVVFLTDRIRVSAPVLRFWASRAKCLTAAENRIEYNYKGTPYTLEIVGADVHQESDHISITLTSGVCELIPHRAESL